MGLAWAARRDVPAAIMEISLLRFNAMTRASVVPPSAASLAPRLRFAAQCIARELRAAGHEAWIVGGAVRDLALGLEPGEVDVATDALPEEVEALFERTVAVGKAFGTILVRVPEEEHVRGGSEAPHDGATELAVEVTTFRAEGAYSDARRPEVVTYGASVQEDARRRDFTCNALYLDPLSDAFLDPERGLEDLAAGRLRCVGEASERFAEDGLRLLRLARFAARLGLEPEPTTLAAARGAAAALRGVSVERVLVELGKMFDSPRPARAFEILHEAGLLEPVLGAEPGTREGLEPTRLEVLRTLGGPLAPATGLALLLWEGPGSLAGVSEAALERLKPSRSLRGEVRSLWRSLEATLELMEAEPTRAATLRVLREPCWPEAARVLSAWSEVTGRPDGELLQDWIAERASLDHEQLFPEPLLEPGDLERSGVPRGPRWGEVLRELETLQLDGELTDRAGALDWLERLGS